jgi:sugar phosphate isomerase/epimerase
MKNLILCSTGAFIGTKSDFNHTVIAKLKPELVYHGFEIFMFDYFADNPNEYESVFKIILEAKNDGAIFYSMHMNKRIGDLISRNEVGDIENAIRLFESNCIYAVKYGVKLLVLHLWGGRPSDKNIHVNIETYPKLKEISDKYGLILTVENIVCNTYKPLDHMKKLWELYPNDIKFTIDTRQAEFHKSIIKTCESAFLWENNLVPHFHMSDYSGEHMDWNSFMQRNPLLGSGDIDFAYLFSFLRSVNFNGSITHEHNFTQESDDLIDYLNKSFEFILKGIN